MNLLAVVSVLVIVYFYFIPDKSKPFSGSNRNIVNPNATSGPTQWQEQDGDWVKEHKNTQERIQMLGLDTRYTIVKRGDDIRELLYLHNDFDTVDAALEKLFSETDNPLQALKYSAIISLISEIRYGESLRSNQNTLDTWVETSPDSYRARLLRGLFYINLAWYYRGNDSDINVLEDDKVQFDQCIAAAADELNTAYSMNPEDPESSAHLITVAVAQNAFEQIPDLLDNVTDINPYHICAHSNHLNSIAYDKNKSIQRIKALAYELRKSSEHFPYLMTIVRSCHDTLYEAGEYTEDEWRDIHLDFKWLEACIKQHTQEPEDLYIQNVIAHIALHSHNYDIAVEFFEKIGDQYLENAVWKSLLEYHESRAYAYASAAFYTEYFLEDKGEMYAETAVNMLPDNAYCHNVYGNILLERNRFSEARQYFIKASDIDPSYAHAKCGLAWVALNLEEYGEAIDWAQQALDLTGDRKMKQDLKRIIRESKHNA